jgi:membrane-bound inhibitor of C-type lysozyme
LQKTAAVFSGFGILFEQAHKRVEITYYCIPKTLEATWNFLEKRNLVKTLPYQEILAFALAMGVIGLNYGDGTDPKTIKGMTLKACNTLWCDKS